MNNPAFVTVIVPSTSFVPTPEIVNTLPVNAKLVDKSIKPENNVEVVPSLCVNVAAANVEPNTTVSASTIVKLPVPKFTAPVNVISPAEPASNVKSSSVPVNVPLITTSSPAPSPVWIRIASVLVNVTFVPNAKPSELLVKSAPITLLPAPF